MRSRSVDRLSVCDPSVQPINHKQHQEESHMRNTTRSFALALSVVVLSSSVTAFAAEPIRKEGIRDRERPTPMVIFKRVVKRLFGISTNEAPIAPIPAPANP
jgi:hypothetical protein